MSFSDCWLLYPSQMWVQSQHRNLQKLGGTHPGFSQIRAYEYIPHGGAESIAGLTCPQQAPDAVEHDAAEQDASPQDVDQAWASAACAEESATTMTPTLPVTSTSR